MTSGVPNTSEAFRKGRGAAASMALLRTMLFSRACDLREDILVRQGRGGPHVSSRGHEALIAIAALLEPTDGLFPYYRGCHLMMGKGLNRGVIARDFLYRGTSTSDGRSMSVHAGSRELGLFPSAAPVASQCLPAVGAAWAHQLRGTGSVAVCSIGDGSTRAGEFYEAVCMAVQLRLPVLFVVEDNRWAISTPTHDSTPFALGVLAPDLRHEVDGTDVDAVTEVASSLVAKLRRGEGPAVLWCHVNRLDPHTSNEDHTQYRASAELDAMVDPVERYAEVLIERGELDRAALERLDAEAHERARAVYREALEDPEPTTGAAHAHLFGPVVEPRPVPFAPEARPTNMVEATQRVLRAGLASFQDLILFGQDIADPKGGVFGFTKGLSTEFPDRVHNAPIAEATIIGTAVGLATQGMRPVFEIQFIDFLAPGFNQLVNNAASLRWRSGGRWSCPMVVYAPYGSYIPRGGLWHSESNEGWWTHIPGLRVAVPSTSEDLVGLFWSAFQDEDPTLILIPKHVFRVRQKDGRYHPVPFGKCRTVREGRDVTLVGWGNAVALCEEAASAAARDGISVEVLDLRTLVPWDRDAVVASLERTGRLVVVQEDARTASFGASVVADVTANEAVFARLCAPPVLVSRPDLPIPCATELMREVLPSVDSVVDAVRGVMRHRRASMSIPPAAEPSRPASTPVAERDDVDVLVVPTLGEGIREVRITELLKQPGDTVAEDEALYELETAKAASVIEAPAAGVLLEWLVEEDDTLEVGDPVARIAREAPSKPSAATSAPAPSPQTADRSDLVALSPRQRALNARFEHSRQRTAPASLFRFVRLEGLVQGAGQLMARSAPDASPYVTVFEAAAFCAARATRAHPALRSVLVDAGTRREYPTLELGVAVHGQGGELTTAVVSDADQLELPAFREALREAVQAAMNGEDRASERTSLVLTYLGDLEVIGGVPLLTAPAAGVLALGAPFPGRPGDAQVSLAFEHQLMNGVAAASYLKSLASCIEQLAAGGVPVAESSALLADPVGSSGGSAVVRAVRETQDPAEAEARLVAHLADLVSEQSGAAVGPGDRDRPFAELGLSSLHLVQLRARIEATLDVDLPMAVFWTAFSVAALARHVLLHLEVGTEDRAAGDDVARLEALAGDDLVAELDRLLDDTVPGPRS